MSRPPDEPEDFGFDVEFDFETDEATEATPPKRGMRPDVGRIGDTIAGLAGRGPEGVDPEVIRRRRIGAVVGLIALVALIVGLVVAFAGGGGGEEQANPPEPIGPPASGITTSTSPEPPPATPPATALPADTVLRPGDSGEEVVALQQALIELGYDPGQPDGDYGAATEEAVASFQQDQGLESDGVAGPTTIEAINTALAERPG